eukprot:scaffold181350_cov28-Tisochrysis_lutea.AAC.5
MDASDEPITTIRELLIDLGSPIILRVIRKRACLANVPLGTCTSPSSSSSRWIEGGTHTWGRGFSCTNSRSTSGTGVSGVIL